jgi:hypothetical protein
MQNSKSPECRSVQTQHILVRKVKKNYCQAKPFELGSTSDFEKGVAKHVHSVLDDEYVVMDAMQPYAVRPEFFVLNSLSLFQFDFRLVPLELGIRLCCNVG